MTIKLRLSPVVGAALISLTVAGALSAAEPAKKTAKIQLPSQVIPTGAEDAQKAAPAAAARSALAAPSSAQPDAAQLESQLLHMTSESSDGLVAVKQKDGSKKVNLDGRFMSVAVARQTTVGGSEVSCLTGKDAVNAVHAAERGEKVSPSKPAPAALEEK